MSGQPSRLEVNLLGPPQILVDGDPIQVATRKAVALVANLAIEGSVSRDRLVDLLLPESTAEKGRGALRRTLSALRNRTRRSLGRADRNRVGMDRDRVEIDRDHRIRFPVGAEAVGAIDAATCACR